MFCGKCGTKNPDNAAFCSQCGAPLSGASAGGAARTAGAVKVDNRKVGIAAAAAVIVVAAVLLVTLLGGRSYKATAEKFVDASLSTKADAEDVIDLFPKKLIDYAMDMKGFTKEDLIEELDSEIRYAKSHLGSELGDDWKITSEIVSEEDLSESELEDLQEYYDLCGIKLSAAKRLKVQLNVKSKSLGEQDNFETFNITVIKSGRSWYVDPNSTGIF